MLDLKLDRQGVTPKDAATIVLVRDSAAGLEVFCVERSKQSRFLGGAVVFPGGKLDDADAGWDALTTEPDPRGLALARDASHLRALCVAAARETVEEAAILLATEVTVDPATLRAPGALRGWLESTGAKLDLAALAPFARWITPEAEARRFDARFFLAIAPADQPGAHDAFETMASFWATPRVVLDRFAAGEVQVAPPTHRTLELLAECTDTAAARALATRLSLEAICPRLVQQGDTMALVLPGDPEHAVKEPVVPGLSRYVLRGERWLAEPAP